MPPGAEASAARPDAGPPSVSEAGLVHLVELPMLQAVFMYGIAISPVGLGYLRRMAKLGTLYVTDGMLSGADEKALVEALHFPQEGRKLVRPA